MNSSIVIDPLEKLLGDIDTTNDFSEMGYPEEVVLIELGEDLYACVNVTPDPVREPDWTINALAAFIDMEEAAIFEMQNGLKGRRVSKTFAQAREIAVSKPVLQAVAVQRNGTTFQLHYVR